MAFYCQTPSFKVVKYTTLDNKLAVEVEIKILGEDRGRWAGSGVGGHSQLS